MKKAFSIILACVILVLSLFACDNKNNKSNTLIKYQISDSVNIIPFPATKLGNEINNNEIEKMCIHLFKQCSIIYPPNYDEFIELDKNTSFEYDQTIWYKTKYIESFSHLQAMYESVFSRDFYKNAISSGISWSFMERDDALFFGRVGGGGGYGDLIANEIDIISKESEKIIIKANMQGVISKGYDDLWEDGDLFYTFIIQNGNWVLEDWIGKKEI